LVVGVVFAGVVVVAGEELQPVTRKLITKTKQTVTRNFFKPRLLINNDTFMFNENTEHSQATNDDIGTTCSENPV
jgi:hypothetical protein